MPYNLSLHTGDKDSADTEGAIYVTLMGDKGHSTKQLLRKSDNEKMFQKGQVSKIVLKSNFCEELMK